MAQSQRKTDAAPKAVDDEGQNAADRYTLLFFLFAGIGAVALMFWIAGFLSGSADEPVNPSLYTAVVSGGIGLVFFILSKRV